MWVIVDRLHFVTIHDSWKVDRLAQIYRSEIVRLHGVSQDIVSYIEGLKPDFGRLYRKSLAQSYNLAVPTIPRWMYKLKE